MELEHLLMSLESLFIVIEIQENIMALEASSADQDLLQRVLKGQMQHEKIFQSLVQMYSGSEEAVVFVRIHLRGNQREFGSQSTAALVSQISDRKKNL